MLLDETANKLFADVEPNTITWFASGLLIITDSFSGISSRTVLKCGESTVPDLS